MSSSTNNKTPPDHRQEGQAGPATGKDAENQPADTTHDKEEASRETQRTQTEGPRRMPQP